MTKKCAWRFEFYSHLGPPAYTRPRSSADRRPDMLRIFLMGTLYGILGSIFLHFFNIVVLMGQGLFLHQVLTFSSIDCTATRTIPISVSLVVSTPEFFSKRLRHFRRTFLEERGTYNEHEMCQSAGLRLRWISSAPVTRKRTPPFLGFIKSLGVLNSTALSFLPSLSSIRSGGVLKL